MGKDWEEDGADESPHMAQVLWKVSDGPQGKAGRSAWGGEEQKGEAAVGGVPVRTDVSTTFKVPLSSVKDEANLNNSDGEAYSDDEDEEPKSQ